MRPLALAFTMGLLIAHGATARAAIEQPEGSSSSRRQTLFSHNTSHGAYGAAVTRFTQVAGESGLLVGGKGAWILNHSFVLGAAGYTLVNPILRSDQSQLSLGYGGLQIEYWFQPMSLVHLNFGALIGGGSFRSLSLASGLKDNFVLMLEPELNGVLNVAEQFQIGAGLSLRTAYNVRIDGYTGKDISGLTGSIFLQAGFF